jgi:hypothetical protein
VKEKFTRFTDYVREHSKENFAKNQKYQKKAKERFTQEIAEIVDKKT